MLNFKILRGSNLPDVTLEQIYYISQIIGAFLAVLGFGLAYRQYKIALAEKRVVHERESIQKAIDLSGYYKDYILGNWMLIKRVYEETGIADILNNIRYSDIEHFDQFELETVLPAAKAKEIREITETEKFIEVLSAVSLVMNFSDHRFSKDLEIPENAETKENIKKRVNVGVDVKGLKYEFRVALSTVLNNMEYFSMHFTHKVADESVVYQSLHVTFIEIVHLLYFDISSNNSRSSEKKFYTNTIELYNIWKKKAEKQAIQCAEGDRKNIKRGTKLNI